MAVKARKVLQVVAWPFVVLGYALVGLSRWMWYTVIAGSPPLMAIWLMKHVDHHKDEEDKS